MGERKQMNELDDPGSGRCNLSEGVHMSHNIMTALLLFYRSYLELRWSEVLSAHLIIKSEQLSCF